MNISDLSLFLIIAQSDSLAQTARKMNISPMQVSRRLTQLEKEIGKRLVQRTTRSISLTQEGIEFLPYAKSIVDTEVEAKTRFQSGNQGATGLLRITAPSGLGHRNIMPLIPELLRENPDLRIDLQLDDDIVDIVSRGIDVAVRVAPLRDSRLVARRIIDTPRVLCASTDYLNHHGIPKVLSDLENHDCLRLSNIPQWIFTKEQEVIMQSIDGRFSCSNVEGVRELCVQGLGLAQLTWLDVKRELDNGTLTEVILQDVEPQKLSVWAVLPTAKLIPQRVVTFIDLLRKELNP